IEKYVDLSPMTMCHADPAAMFNISLGLLDTGFLKEVSDLGIPLTEFGYFAAPVVMNVLNDRASNTTGDRDHIQLTGFNVELLAAPGQALPGIKLPTKYFVNAAGGSIPPGGGHVGALAEIMPADV